MRRRYGSLAQGFILSPYCRPRRASLSKDAVHLFKELGRTKVKGNEHDGRSANDSIYLTTASTWLREDWVKRNTTTRLPGMSWGCLPIRGDADGVGFFKDTGERYRTNYGGVLQYWGLRVRGMEEWQLDGTQRPRREVN